MATFSLLARSLFLPLDDRQVPHCGWDWIDRRFVTIIKKC
jgi:hypothetical protein